MIDDSSILLFDTFEKVKEFPSEYEVLQKIMFNFKKAMETLHKLEKEISLQEKKIAELYEYKEKYECLKRIPTTIELQKRANEEKKKKLSIESKKSWMKSLR